MLKDMTCGLEIKQKTKMKCEGNLFLVLISRSNEIEIHKETGIIQFKSVEKTSQGEIRETNGIAHEYLGPQKENMFLLKCNLCGRLYGLSGHFLTTKNNYIHFWKGFFYVLEKNRFNKILRMSIFPKIGTATKVVIETSN